MGNRIKSAIDSYLEAITKLPNFETSSVQELSANQLDASEVEKAAPAIKSLVDLGEYLKSVSVPAVLEEAEALPTPISNEIVVAINGSRNVSTQILPFIGKASGSTQPPRHSEAKFKSLADEVEKYRADLWRILNPISRSVEVSAQLKTPDLQSQIQQAEKYLRRLEEASQRADNAAHTASEAATDAAASVLSESNVEALDKIIDHHKEAAKWWLIGFFVCSLATLVVLIWILIETYNFTSAVTNHVDPSVGQIVALALAKLLIISFMFGLCVSFSRNYQTHTHNLIVNRQRRIAWISFLQIYQALTSTDQELKQELVRQAAQAIFAHTSSGFLNKNANEFSPLASLVGELVKSKTA